MSRLDGETKRAILDEILELTAPPKMQPNDIALQEYADALGVTRATAKLRLAKLVEQGVLETLIVQCDDGKRRRVYRKVQQGVKKDEHDRSTWTG